MSIAPTLLTAVGMAAVAATGWWLVGPVVRLVLPKYVGAVPAVQWWLLVSVVGSFGIVQNAYNVVRRQDLYAAAIVLGMGAYVGSLLWLTRGNVSLVAFPQAMLVGRVVFTLAGYLLLVPLALRHRAASARGS
jgi:hypothetical protein